MFLMAAVIWFTSCRVFVPNYVSKVKVQLVNCSTRNKSGEACPVALKIRARAPPVHNSSALDCREWNPCELEVAVPAWEQWYYVLVERYLTSSDVYFRIGVQVTGEALSFCYQICAKSGEKSLFQDATVRQPLQTSSNAS